MTSMLCSMMSTVLPLFTSLFSTSINILISSKCKPVVGSSRMYKVFPVSRFDNSVASFTRCASPPERVVEGCPKVIYPNPTSCNVLIFCKILGKFSKNTTASSIVRFSTSFMDLPLKRTSRVSRLYRFPWHASHFTCTSGRKFISMTRTPAPWHVSQRPPFTLNENRPDL